VSGTEEKASGGEQSAGGLHPSLLLATEMELCPAGVGFLTRCGSCDAALTNAHSFCFPNIKSPFLISKGIVTIGLAGMSAPAQSGSAVILPDAHKQSHFRIGWNRSP
jgi:hypothetical protein